jgi:hypothetical protein
MDNRQRRFDALHWLEPGLPDIDAMHWLPFLTSAELGLNRPKLTLELATSNEPSRGKRNRRPLDLAGQR